MRGHFLSLQNWKVDSLRTSLYWIMCEHFLSTPWLSWLAFGLWNQLFLLVKFCWPYSLTNTEKQFWDCGFFNFTVHQLGSFLWLLWCVMDLLCKKKKQLYSLHGIFATWLHPIMEYYIQWSPIISGITSGILNFWLSQTWGQILWIWASVSPILSSTSWTPNILKTLLTQTIIKSLPPRY